MNIMYKEDEDFDELIIEDDSDELKIEDDSDELKIEDDSDELIIEDDSDELKIEDDSDELKIEDNSSPVSLEENTEYDDSILYDDEDDVFQDDLFISGETFSSEQQKQLQKTKDDLNEKREACSTESSIEYIDDLIGVCKMTIDELVYKQDPDLVSKEKQDLRKRDAMISKAFGFERDFITSMLADIFINYYYMQIGSDEEIDIDTFMEKDQSRHFNHEYILNSLPNEYAKYIKELIALGVSISITDLLGSDLSRLKFRESLKTLKKSLEQDSINAQVNTNMMDSYARNIKASYLPLGLKKVFKNAKDIVYVDKIIINVSSEGTEDDADISIKYNFKCGKCGKEHEMKNHFYTYCFLADPTGLSRGLSADKIYRQIDIPNANVCPDCNAVNILAKSEMLELKTKLSPQLLYNNYRDFYNVAADLTNSVNPIIIRKGYEELYTSLPNIVVIDTDIENAELEITDDFEDEVVVENNSKISNDDIMDVNAYNNYLKTLEYFKDNILESDKSSHEGDVVENYDKGQVTIRPEDKLVTAVEYKKSFDMKCSGLVYNNDIETCSHLFFLDESKKNVNNLAKIICKLAGENYKKIKLNAFNSICNFISSSNIYDYFNVHVMNAYLAQYKSKGIIDVLIKAEGQEQYDLAHDICMYIGLDSKEIFNEKNEFVPEGLSILVAKAQEWFNNLPQIMEDQKAMRNQLLNDIKLNYRLLAFTPIIETNKYADKNSILHLDTELVDVLNSIADLMVIYNLMDTFSKYIKISAPSIYKYSVNLASFEKDNDYAKATSLLSEANLLTFESRTKKVVKYSVMANMFSHLRNIEYDNLSKFDKVKRYLTGDHEDDFNLMKAIADCQFITGDFTRGKIYDSPIYSTIYKGFSELLALAEAFIDDNGSSDIDRVYYYLKDQFSRKEIEDGFIEKYNQISFNTLLIREENETLAQYMDRMISMNSGTVYEKTKQHVSELKEMKTKYAIVLSVCDLPCSFVWTYSDMDIELYFVLIELMYLVMQRPITMQLETLNIKETLANKLRIGEDIEIEHEDENIVYLQDKILYTIYSDHGYNATSDVNSLADPNETADSEIISVDATNRNDVVEKMVKDQERFFKSIRHLPKEDREYLFRVIVGVEGPLENQPSFKEWCE